MAGITSALPGIKITQLPSVIAARVGDIYPVVQNGITSKETVSQLIDLLNTSLTGYVPIPGGTMTGFLILNADPLLPLGAATKEYVDTVASGFTVILAALAGTTANLNATYNNGAAGVGATLTDASGTFAAFTVDGVTPALNARILVKNQTTTFQNGVYALTTNGDGISIPYQLTRTTDYDQAPSEIHPGTLIAVNSGTVNATTSWLETATVTVIGTDPILFSQFSFGPTQFLLKANNLSDVNSAPTSRTNLGLGSAALKAASDVAKASLASINGVTVINNIAIFSDIAGTIKDSGLSNPITKLNKQKFIASGTYTPTVGMVYCIIEAQAQGAGGGGSAASTGGLTVAAGGGGAGSYTKTIATAATIGGSQVVTIANSGGTGGAPGLNAGIAGSDATLGVICVAKGGSGGGGAGGATFGTGGVGGVAGIGDLTLVGNAGTTGCAVTGVSTGVPTGCGGHSFFGGGSIGQTLNIGGVAGNSAGNYGSGGNGGSSLNGSSAKAGGNGGPGVIFITEFISA